MKLAALALAVCVLVVCVRAQPGDYVGAFSNKYSWEVIFANNTSFLSQIDVHMGVIYVAGEGYVREVVEQPFELSYHHAYFRQQYTQFIDFKVFVHRNVSYVFGPVAAGAVRGAGISHPLQISSLTDSDRALLPAENNSFIQLASVAATDMNEHVVVYGAGWFLGEYTGRLRVSFAVFRLFLHPNHTNDHNSTFLSPPAFSSHPWNETSDVVIIPDSEGYTEYHRTFKPWIFHSTRLEQVIVVDPATDRVYRLHAPSQANLSLTYASTTETAFSSTNITSATYDDFTGTLVIGTKGNGIQPGTIVAIDTTDSSNPRSPMKVLFTHTLKTWESNPKALEVRGDSLYVGLNDGSYIMHLNLTLRGQVIGYSTLPWYARSVYDIHASRNHIYIVTNEQYSKVARTLHENFCSTPCDYLYGYCDKGKCTCHPGYALGTNNVRCEPAFTTTTTRSGTGGMIALGVLSALAVGVAVAGWVVVWRFKQGLQVFGFGSKYSLNSSEREGFLADD